MKERMKLLIAHDGSSYTDAALRELRRAGLPEQVEALVLSVADLSRPTTYEPADPSVTDSATPSVTTVQTREAKAIAQAREVAMQAVQRLQTDFPGWELQAEARADSPARGVIKKAEEWRPDLLVVGSRGRSALGRLFLGSVSQKVLTYAACSVRVVRSPAEQNDSPVRIIIGIDGSADAEATVGVVAARVWPSSTQVRVISVTTPRMSSASLRVHPATAQWVAEAYEYEKARASQVTKSAAEMLLNRGLNVSPLVKPGDPKYILTKEAKRWGADSIFVGARGLSNFERLLLGSVSTTVATRAHCSVEVVRANVIEKPDGGTAVANP